VNVLEPWVLLRLLAGLVAAALFVRAAFTSWKVLRHFDLRVATEGQLALEKQVELSSTFIRVATLVQVGSLVLTCLAADRLSHGIRGAMCAYGVFHASEWGFRALAATSFVAVMGGVLAELHACDARLPRLDLARTLSIGTLLMAPLAVADLALTATFLLDLDLSVVASCCSVQLDAVASGNGGYASGPRALTTILAPLAAVIAIGVALLAARRPRTSMVTLAGALAVLAFPLAIAAVVLEVAPHAFEIPQHVCPFCLLKGDVLGLGYPLFGSIFLALVWGVGAAASAILTRRLPAREALDAFLKNRLRREAVAWSIALVLGALPVARYAWMSGGASLFP
jgi:hypothetical protein